MSVPYILLCKELTLFSYAELSDFLIIAVTPEMAPETQHIQDCDKCFPPA